MGICGGTAGKIDGLSDHPKPESFKPVEEHQNELDTLKAENKALKERLDTANHQLAEVTTDRQQLQAQLDRTLAELAELKQNPPGAIEQPPIGLPERAPEIYNFFKQWLPADTKWPKKTLLELRKFLETKE